MPARQRERHALMDPARRGLLKAAGALGLSSLALAGCASRVAAPADLGEGAPSAGPSAAAPRRDAPVPALRPGGRVAIVAPASAADGAAFEAAEWLQARGYDPRIMPAALTRSDAPYDYLAGDDDARLNDLHAAFADPAIDAVSVCVANFAHADLSIQALKAGKHVLCEKPMAITLEECQTMLAEAEKAGKRLLIGQNQRLAKAHAKAKELVAAGEIGRVITFRTFFGHGGPETWSITPGKNTWFFDKKRAAMGAMACLLYTSRQAGDQYGDHLHRLRSVQVRGGKYSAVPGDLAPHHQAGRGCRRENCH